MKKLIVFMLCLMLFGCSSMTQEVDLNLFDIKKANEVAGDYMNALSKGDIKNAESLCDNKPISDEEVQKLENNKFIAYKVEETNEGADYVYIKYYVIRGNNTEIRSDLDSIELKIKKIEDDYKITEIQAKNIKQVYLDKDNLRIIDQISGKNQLLLRKRDFPKEVYAKSDEVTLTMDTVPEVQFSKINVGFQGKSVGVALSNGNKTLIALSVINNQDDSNGSSEAEAESDASTGMEEVFEKPIGNKIIGYDLIDDGITEKILFTDNDEALVIQSKKQGKGSSVRVYKNPSGELMDLKIDKKFPQDKYSLDIQKITEGKIHVYVSPTSSDANEEGKFIIDIKNMNIYKDE